MQLYHCDASVTLLQVNEFIESIEKFVNVLSTARVSLEGSYFKLQVLSRKLKKNYGGCEGELALFESALRRENEELALFESVATRYICEIRSSRESNPSIESNPKDL